MQRFSSLAVMAFVVLFFASCYESMEERIAREAREFTEKNCPTPEVNNTITDSIVFYPSTRTYTTYCTLTGEKDDKVLMQAHRDELVREMKKILKADAMVRRCVDENISIRYICHSQKNPSEVILDFKYSPKELK